ncbi:MAG: hypothetical protein WC767_00265 [Candidatus Paceibacterota bacterium]|jgi:hypothetical protein
MKKAYILIGLLAAVMVAVILFCRSEGPSVVQVRPTPAAEPAKSLSPAVVKTDAGVVVTTRFKFNTSPKSTRKTPNAVN